MKVVKKNVTLMEKNGKGIFWSLTCLLLLANFLYVYFVNTAALNGVRFGKAQHEIAILGANASELESHYFSLQKLVTLSLAYERGFQDVTAVRFISAKTVGTVARANEI